MYVVQRYRLGRRAARIGLGALPAPDRLRLARKLAFYDELMRVLARHGIEASTSRKGNRWGNSVMERFFPSLKMERVWQRDYANAHEVHRDIVD